MATEKTGRQEERGEHADDPAGSPPETSGHALRDETGAKAATKDDDAAEGPEVEGHLLTNPYLLEMRDHGYHEQMRDDISYERPAKGSGPGIAKRLTDKVRRRTST